MCWWAVRRAKPSVVCKFRAVAGVVPIAGLYDTKEEAIEAAKAFIDDL